MSLSGYSADVEIGASVQPLPPGGTEGIGRGRGPFLWRRRVLGSASTSDYLSTPREAASGGVRLLDREIEALWKFTYRNQPCPSKTDEANRWKLLELAEKFWNDEVADITSRLDRAKDDVSSTNNELYQILGFYSVFQGLLVGAACQSQKLSCRHRDPLFTLCVITTVYALIGFYLKFQDFHGKQIYAEIAQQKRNQRKAQITRLRRETLQFEFLAPTSQEEPSKFWLLTIRFLLVLAILAFSGAIIGCINWILC